jgi:hypothetical protein
MERTVREYLKNCSDWQTRKEIFNAVYPIFEKTYSQDTFNRLLTRTLNRLIARKLILKHQYQPLYYSAEADILQLARHLKTFIETFDIADLPLSRLLNFNPMSIPIKKAEVEEAKA